VPATIRLRFAPSPTGRLHIGGARTALFNWAYARRHGGAFLLRVEDTDPARSRREHEDEILAGLRWLGIDWDEGPDKGGPYGPYRQSERRARHAEIAARLLAEGRAYRDFSPAPAEEPPPAEPADAAEAAAGTPRGRVAYRGADRDLAPETSDRRAAAGEPFVVRFHVPDGRTRFEDRIRGAVAFDNREVDDWVMLRSDGSPTYNFVVVCDDADMRITHVLRGEEHLVNTPKQVLLYGALGLEPPEFGHLPLMLGTDRKKLSKRTGDTALLDYKDKGYPRDAVVNFLCLQGWALDGTTEIFSVEELVRHFDVADVGKGGSIFDPEKFLWMAGEYARRDPVEHLARMCAPYVVRAGQMTAAEIEARRGWFHDVVRGVQERIRLYSELPERIAFLFAPDEAVPYDPKAEAGARRHEGRAETLCAFADWLRPRLAEGAAPAALREAGRAWVAERGLKFPALFQPLRCALTGEAAGPDLYDVIAWLGPERALRRIETGVRRLA
jgi:glutamyl-tRNA synthetase